MAPADLASSYGLNLVIYRKDEMCRFLDSLPGPQLSGKLTVVKARATLGNNSSSHKLLASGRTTNGIQKKKFASPGEWRNIAYIFFLVR